MFRSVQRPPMCLYFRASAEWISCAAGLMRVSRKPVWRRLHVRAPVEWTLRAAGFAKGLVGNAP